MGLWKNQKDLIKETTELYQRSTQLERPSMRDGVRQANDLMDQMGRQQRLMQVGIAAQARIDSAQDTGGTVNYQPLVDFTMTVEVPGRAPYRVATRQPVQRLMTASYAPGQTIPVRVDPEHPELLMVDLARFATHSSTYQQAVATGRTPGVPAQDPAERLQRLADLRDRGVLTESEFAAQKARVLADL